MSIRYLVGYVCVVAMFFVGGQAVTAQSERLPAGVNRVHSQAYTETTGLVENPAETSFIMTDIFGRGDSVEDSIRRTSVFVHGVMINMGVLLLLFAFLYIGTMYLLYANDEGQRKKNITSLLYLLYGSAIYFSVSWILGQVGLNQVENEVINATREITDNVINQVLLPTIAFLSYLLYFIAIIMIIVYGYKFVQAYDAEDKITAAKRGLLNVVLTLLFARAIPFVYDIMQSGDRLTEQGTALLTSLTQIGGILLGIVMVLLLIYSGYTLITSGGESSKREKASTIIKNILLVGLVIGLFLLITSQLTSDIGPLNQYSTGEGGSTVTETQSGGNFLSRIAGALGF